jgi:hypothetical protein
MTEPKRPHYTAARHIPATESERNAMRAFLQRSEVRLSTMHRVAVGFLSGAGLLFLFPVFLKDSILLIIREFIHYSFSTDVAVAMRGSNAQLANTVAIILLLFPFALSIGIPALALLLLIRDTVRFYFVNNAPGFPEELFQPRFALTGVAFSPDESESIKTKIQVFQYGSDLIHFVLPSDERKAADFDSLIDSQRMIVPRSRKLPKLIVRGVVESKDGKPVEQFQEDDLLIVRGLYEDEQGVHQILPEAYRERTVKDIDRFNAALGLAGVIDRPLREEVAKQEASLARHAINLRKLVFRYFQALLILLWTAFVTFLMLPFITDGKGRFSFLLVVGSAFLVWSALAPFVVGLPVTWLANQSKANQRKKGIEWLKKADGVERFEVNVRRLSFAAVICTLLAIGIELIIRL